MSMCLFLECTSHLNVGLMHMVTDDNMRKVHKYIIQRSHNLWFEAKLILSSQRDAKKVYCYISPKVVLMDHNVITLECLYLPHKIKLKCMWYKLIQGNWSVRHYTAPE